MSRLTEDGNEEAADRLAVLAAERLAELASGRGDADTLTYLIDAGNGLATDRRVEVAAAHSEVDPALPPPRRRQWASQLPGASRAPPWGGR